MIRMFPTARSGAPFRILLATSALLGLGCTTALGTTVPAKWADGGNPNNPQSQYTADKRQMVCGDNTALLFRVRGSGEDYGTDALGAWTFAAGRDLIRQGWQVRDLQAIYPAPSVPGISVDTAGALRRYLQDQRGSAPATTALLTQAVDRCPQRRILIAGYSSGNIVLRYALTALPPRARAAIGGVYLFSDPTADGTVDASLRHPASLDGRLTQHGIYRRFLGAVPSYARLYAGARFVQMCKPGDLVCEGTTNMVTGLRFWKQHIHQSYQWARVGRFAAAQLGQAPRDPAPVVSSEPTQVPAVVPPPPVLTTPKPVATNLVVVNYGGGHVGVAFDVGWQTGRDPVTCHFFQDGVEVFTAQCGTHSSKQFYGVPAGTHSYYATVSDQFGVYSDRTITITTTV